MDRVGDELLEFLFHYYKGEIKRQTKAYGSPNRVDIVTLNAILELRARREAERTAKKDRPDPLSQALNEGEGTYRP